MITLKAKDLDYSGTKDRVEGECLSTDTKPTTYANGSCLIEMDTGDRFMFDEANGEWLNITSPGGGGGAEVWLTGNNYVDEDGHRIFDLSNVGETDHFAELWNNAELYRVFLNGEELPDENNRNWYDDLTTPTKAVIFASESEANTVYMDASTAPTSVEVSVKAK